MALTQSPEKISIPQARKLVLHSQRLPGSAGRGPSTVATLNALEHLGYIQIDTISVVERAHHHTLWNRNPRYQNGHIDELIADKTAFEYWSHAAAYLPMRDYRFSLPRKRAIKSGAQDHWFQRDPKVIRYVYDRIKSEGPLMAKDFEHSGKRVGEWEVKPAKKALETLYMQGDLMICRRHNFHKVYDLTERVLPGNVQDNFPSEDEHARFMIRQYLTCNGLAQSGDFSYLLKGVKPAIVRALQQMDGDGELTTVRVGEASYYTLPESLTLLGKPLSRRKLKILSPFDNLLIQRHRMRDLFNFDYQIECYVPAAKRKYGYFCLPILWDSQLVARLDGKADRKTGILKILSLHHEPSLKKVDEFRNDLDIALADFARFNGCDAVEFL